MVDRWLVFVLTQFISATIGFAWGFATGNLIFIYIGGFFFSLGTFAVTRWGFDRWRGKGKGKDKSGRDGLKGKEKYRKRR